MNWTPPLYALLLASCVAAPEPESSGGGGKADGATADAACSRDYIEWLLLELKPALEAQPIDAARAAELEALTEQAPCRGTLLDANAFTTWLDVMTSTAFHPYYGDYGDATVAFLSGSSGRGDHDLFVERSQPTEAMRLAVRVMTRVRNPFVIDDLATSQWLGFYRVMAELVLHPLMDPALAGYVEGYWTLNPGEAAMLDLLAETLPESSRDGSYAAWIDRYGELLAEGVSIDMGDDYNAAETRPGCEPYEQEPCGRERFLDRFVALQPRARGDLDSAAWMWQLQLWASVTAISSEPFLANDTAQLARVDAVRPSRLTGKEAYRVWLSTVAETATASNQVPYTSSVLPAKPCTDEGDEHYTAFSAEHAALPASVLDAARPVACP